MPASASGVLGLKRCAASTPSLHGHSVPVVFNLWVVTPLEVEIFSQGLPMTIGISDIYVVIHSSSRIIVMK